jgi:adenylate cyclase
MSQELNRKQSVVFFSDIVGYTRLMGQDENAAFDLMILNLQIHQEVLSKYQGTIIKELGDGILAVFETVTDALTASLEIQKTVLINSKYEIRIGLQSGEIIFDHGDVFGDAVNVASRIQSVGVPTSILISDRVYREIINQEDFQITKLGSFNLKNVSKAIELYALSNPPLTVPKRSEVLKNIKYQESSSWKFRIGIIVALIILGTLFYKVFFNGSVWEKEKSVAVLPFINLSGDQELDYFINGLTENLIVQISKISSIKTISYSTMEEYKNPNASLDSLADALGVITILKGTVEKSNQGYRFKLQLVDAKENKNIWTDEYTREGTDLTQIQNEIAREIAKVLDVKLTAEESIQIGKGETSNAEAYDLLFQAKSLYNKGFGDPKQFFEAAELLKKAIRLDPNYALAYTLLAKTYFQIAYDDPNGSWYDLSLEMSSKALELEPKLAEGYSARGIVYYDLGQYTKAKNTLEISLSFYPNLSDAIGNLATIEFAQGNLYEALTLQTKSSNLGPNAYLPYQNMGWIYKILGKNERGNQLFDKSLEISKNPVTYELKAMSLIEEGKKNEALDLLTHLPLADSVELNLRVAGSILYYAGEYDSAFKVWDISIKRNIQSGFDKYYSTPINYAFLLKERANSRLADSLLNATIQVKIEAMSLGSEDYYLPLDIATAYAVKRQPLESIKYLQIAYERGWRDYFFTEFNPAFSELRKDSRYRKVLAQIQDDIESVNQKLTSTSLQRDR